MQQVLEKAGGFFDGKARLADVALERNFGVETDSPLLEGGVSFGGMRSCGGACVAFCNS
jgi:hypothetical protein